MKNVTTYITSLLMAVILSLPGTSYAQESVPPANDSRGFRLVVPVLSGGTAPFSGILLSEDDFRLALEMDASSEHWETESRVFERQLETERILYEAFITEQRNRINELSNRGWWDENGTWFMLVVGVIVGVAASAILVGLSTK